MHLVVVQNPTVTLLARGTGSGKGHEVVIYLMNIGLLCAFCKPESHPSPLQEN